MSVGFNPVTPVQFGRRDDGRPGRLRKGAMTAAALGALALPLAASTPAFAAPSPGGGGQGQFAVSKAGDGFSAEVPDTAGVKNLDPGPYECTVTRVTNLHKTEADCAKGDKIVSDAKSAGLKEGFFGGLGLAVVAALAVGWNKIKRKK